MDQKIPLITLASPDPSSATNGLSEQPKWLDHICSMNTHGLVNKMDLFQSNVYSNCPDIFTVTET